MVVHRLLVLLLACAAVTGVAVGGDLNDGGSEVATLDDQPELGEGGDVDPAASIALPSGSEDPPPAPVDGDGGHMLDDSVIDETIKVPTMYQGCEFKGSAVNVETSVSDVANIGIEAGSVSSMKTPEGYVVTIFNQRNFQGYSKTFVGGQVHCLKNYNMGDGHTWNDQIASIRILSAKPTKSAADTKLDQIKEKEAKQRENHAVLSEAKNKLAQKEAEARLDAERVHSKEVHTKGAENAEAKVKAHTRDHASARESEELAKNEAENGQKSEELNAKSVEKEKKQGHEKAGKANIEKKRELSYKRRAKEKRTKMEKAKAVALDAEEKHGKSMSEKQKKSTKKEAAAANRVLKQRKNDEGSAKVALNNADASNENAEKSVQFANEMLEKGEQKTMKLKQRAKDAKEAQGMKFQELQKQKAMLATAEQSEVDAKQTEKFAKHSETRAKDKKARQEAVKERSRKITVDKENTAKSVRSRVENAIKKGKITNEIADKKERNTKHGASENERACKESDRKMAHKKELLDKAQVRERHHKYMKYSEQYKAAMAHADDAKKHAEKQSKIVDVQREKRSERKIELAQKSIQKKIKIQKKVAASESLIKGKLSLVTRQLEDAKMQARESGEKSNRISRETDRTQEEREKRGQDLEGRNKYQQKLDSEAGEAAEKERAKRNQAEDHMAGEEEKKKRKLERVQKLILATEDESEQVRQAGEEHEKALRKQTVATQRLKNKVESKEESSERALKESEKKEKGAQETGTKSANIEAKLRFAAGRKKKEAEGFIKKAANIESNKEKAEKQNMEFRESNNKAKLKEGSIIKQVDNIALSVKEGADKISSAYVQRDKAQERFDKNEVAENGAARMGEFQSGVDKAKGVLEKLKESEKTTKDNQKEKVGALTRIKEKKSKLQQKVNYAETQAEKRAKREKVLKEQSEAAKEAESKDNTNEANAKSEANEAHEKSLNFKKNEDTVKTELKSMTADHERNQKTQEDQISKQHELHAKKESFTKKLAGENDAASEAERKVARAKQAREDTQAKASEAQEKVDKLLRLKLKKHVNEMAPASEKHVKNAVENMRRKVKRAQAESQWVQNEERNSDKSFQASKALVKEGEKKLQDAEGAILASKMDMQRAKNAVLTATSNEKKKLAQAKYNDVEHKFTKLKESKQLIIDDNVEVKMQNEKAQKHELRAKDTYAESRRKIALFSESEDEIQRLNRKKMKRREEEQKKEKDAKQDYADKNTHLKQVKHDEKFYKWRVNDAVATINKARKEEKKAVDGLQKYNHQQSMFQASVDEKARKNAHLVVAHALEVRNDALKAVSEALVKKGETVSNVLMVAEEKKRKAERKVEESTELQGKTEAAWKNSKKRRQFYSKEYYEARLAYKKRRSNAGQTATKKIMDRAHDQLKAFAVTEADDKYKYDAAIDEVHKYRDIVEGDEENLKAAKEDKTKVDARIQHAQSDCTAANRLSNDGAAGTQESRYQDLKKKFRKMKIEYAAANERKKKKAKAEGVWHQLEDATDKLAKDKVDPSKQLQPDKVEKQGGKPKTIEDENKILADKVEADESSSATNLANEILNGDEPDHGFQEGKISMVNKQKSDETHPLYRYALERKEKASELTNSEGDAAGQDKKNELLHKSKEGMSHFETLKKAEAEAPRDDDGKLIVPNGFDTFGKWDKRVGTEYRALGIVPNKKPTDPDVAEPEESPDVMLEESEGKGLNVPEAAELLAEEMLRNERLYMTARAYSREEL